MRLYFLRHGEADWPNWDRPDDERPLTERGKKEMRKVAKFLCELDLPLDDIVSSLAGEVLCGGGGGCGGLA